MPLNIEVKGSPDSVRETSEWLRQLAASVHDCGTQVRAAASESESGWVGQAGDGFRAVLTRAGGGVDTLAAKLTEVATQVDAFADDLDTVKTRMEQAKALATAAKLRVTDTLILEPAPVATTLSGLTSVMATQVVAMRQRQQRAYQQATELVADARRRYDQAVAAVSAVAADIGASWWEKKWLNTLDFAGNLADGARKQIPRLRAEAQRLRGIAERAANLKSRANRVAMAKLRWRYGMASGKVSATADLVARTVPAWVSTTADDLVKAVNPAFDALKVSKIATPVLQRMPVVGLAITTVGIGYDIQAGKNPVTSAASGLGGLVIGSVVGGAVLATLPVSTGVVLAAGVSAGAASLASLVGGWAIEKVGDAVLK